MKTKLLLLLLFASSITFAQTWNQVGATQFTDFASDGAIAFDNAGSPYMAYINPTTSNVHVKKFNGTSWVNVGSTAVSTVSAANIAITIRLSDNQPIVAFRSTSNNAMYAFRRNGTYWTPVINNVTFGTALSDHRLQIQTNPAGDIRVSGRRTDQKLTIVEETYGGVQTIFTENLIHTNNQYNGDHRYDFADWDQYYLSWEDNYNSSQAGRKAVGAASTSWDYTTGTATQGKTLKNISGIVGENYLASFNDVYQSSVDQIMVYNGTTLIKYASAANDIVQFRKSSTDDKLYLMYADDTTENMIFEYYNKNTSVWSTIPAIGLNSGISNFFVKMEMNPIDGNMYVLYLDGGKASVKMYTVPPLVNLEKMYVDANATGTSDGSSWVNAYTSLINALNNLGTNTTEIWVAAGTYTPDVSNRNTSFAFGQDNLQVLGGFDGTETLASERNISANPTILSGDLNGNDTGVGQNGFNRLDNSKNVVTINGENITLDGLIVSDAHYENTTGGEGAAIFKNYAVTSFTMKNCTVKDNYAYTIGVVSTRFNLGGSLTIENCVFDNNNARYASGLYVLTGNNQTATVDITNSLFTNNISKDRSSSYKGYTGSAAWIRANGTSSNLTTTITNCTFANNTDIGTQSGSQRGALSLARRTDGSSTHNATINNSIFYNNEGTGGATTVAVNQGHVSMPNLTFVNNSIDEDAFSNLTYLTNTSNSNPLFTDSTNNDFTLQTGSPAIDSGDNTKIPAGVTTDLLGNQRIHNTIVDLGTYEHGATLGVEDFESNNEFTIYPNPTSSILNIKIQDDIKNIEIYNVQGQQVLVGKNKSVDVSNLALGIYLLKVETTKGNFITKRFIKH
ncbi:T9SS type A sorting domain-containing protein [Olleya sp. R77988]|uniref:T9SS type A sorting domain-containing protein n=1 Tax=Olleya sp. R77988 TaxID=3093875 RepID=UPI0037CB09CD